MTNLDEKFAPNNSPIINFQSNGVLYLSNSQLFMLGKSDSMIFNGGTSQVVALTNNLFNLSTVSVSGHLLSTGNCWQGNPSVTQVKGAVVTEMADACGTMSTSGGKTTKKS